MDEESSFDADFHINEKEDLYRIQTVSVGGSISSSPSFIDKLVIFGSNDTYVYALDKEGNKEWSFKTNDVIMSSPACHKGSVVIGSSDGSLYCLSANGELKWKFLSGGKIWSIPSIVDDVVYFGSNNGLFYAVSLEDGRELWRFYIGADTKFCMSASFINDSIIIGGFGHLIFCLSKDGKLLWRHQTGGHNAQTPLILDKNDNEISSFKKRVFSSFPRGDGARIFAGSGDGLFRCLDVDGNIVWKFFANRMGASSPAFSNGSICFGSYDGRIYSLDTSGSLRWKFQANNKIISSPVILDGMLYCGSSDNNIYALNMEKGQLEWRFLTDGEVISSPCINDGIIYFGSWDGHFYAISLDEKELVWKFRTSLDFPSFIRKPAVVETEARTNKNIMFKPTETIKGYGLKSSSYSAITGELTGAFYGRGKDKRKKSPYDFGISEY